MRERVCKNCGGRQYAVVGQNMVKCQFCGTLYVDEHASKEEETLTVWAYEKLRQFKFDEALDEFDKILALYPMSFEAYFGKVLAKHKIVLYSRRGTSSKKPRFFGDEICKINDDPDFVSAVENAPAESARTYTETAKLIEKIAESYKNVAGAKTYDVVLCAMNFDRTNPNDKLLDTVRAFEEKGLSTYFVQEREKETEEETFNALKTASVFVLYANKTTGFNDSEVKNLFDRYRYFISEKQKSATSFVVAFDNGVTEDVLPKDLTSIKNIIDLSGDGQVDELALKVKAEKEKALLEVAKIEKVSVKKVSSVKKKKVEVESINAAELGNYKVENLEMSEANKIKWIFISLKNGDFQSAREMAEKELQSDPNNAELLFATLLCDYKVRTAGEFFLDIANLKEKERIDNILKFAPKEFAEMIVDNWGNLVMRLDSVEYYNSFLLYLAQYNTPNRERLISAAETKALETLDPSLIDKVLKCFQNDDVDRFVDFYFMLAQKSGDDNYYKKVLDIDAGHEQSNIAMLLKNFKDSNSKLEFRKKDIVEDTLKYLSKEKRAKLISSIVNIILPVSYIDLQKAQQQLDFYLAYVEDDKSLAEILKAVADYFQQMRFYTAAEKYITIAISKDKTDAQLYWKLIQIKCHCNSEAKLVKSKVKISQMPEWESLLACADSAQAEKYGAVISKSNLYSGEKSDIADEWLDKKVLTEKLNDFVLRNNKILLEMVSEEGKNVLRGANYFKLQLEPFENYVNKLKGNITLEEYQDVANKIATRLNLLDLTLDMSVNVAKLEGREAGLKAAKVEKLAVKTPKKQKEKTAPSVEVEVEYDKHKKFMKRYLYAFLEMFPILFTTLLLAVIIAIPKEVYMYFNQNFVIALVCLSAAVSLVNLVYFLIKKNKLHKNWKTANLVLMFFGFLNVALMCIGFYLMPTVVTINNAKEFKTLLHNAPYAELRLENDVDMENVNWKPCAFSGTLDGNGFTVSNLNVRAKKKIALFSSNSGEVKKLQVYYTTKKLSGISNFAGIAVKNSGKIKECKIFCNGTVWIETSKDFVFGGIASQNKGGAISDCEVNLNIRIDASKNNIDFGGLAGAVKVGGTSTIKSNRCSIYLNLTGKSLMTANVGGLVGTLDNFEEKKLLLEQNSANLAGLQISGNAEQLFVGGLVGDGKSGSENNYSTGTIGIASTFTNVSVGGLYGKYVNSETGISISHSYSAVVINCENTMKVGGLVGTLGGVVKYSFCTSDRKVVGEVISAFADATVAVRNEVKAYSSIFNFNSKIWNLSGDGLPTLK